MKNYFVSQNKTNDCGIACLLMIFKYYNINAEYNKLIKESNINKEGISAYDIIKLANKYNFTCAGYKGVNIDNIKTPFIAHTINKNNHQHFVVVFKVSENTLKIGDPSIGIINVPKNEFLKKYTSVVITFNLNDKLPIKKVLRKKKIIFKIVLVTLFWSFISILYSYTLSYSIKLILKNASTTNLINVLIFFLILGLLKEIMLLVKNKLSLKFKLLIDKTLTQSLINKVLSFPNKFYQTHPTGELISKVYDLSYIKDIIEKLIEIVFINTILLLIILVFFLIKYQLLFAVSILLLILIYVINYVFFKKNSYKNHELQIENENYTESLISIFNNIITIKNLSKERFFINKNLSFYNKLLDNYKNLYNLFIKKDFLINIIIIIYEIISLVICIYNELLIDEIVFISSLTMMFSSSVNSIFSIYGSFADFKSAKKRLDNIYKEKSINNICNDLIINKIKFKKLNYSYDNNKVLKNINYNLPMNKWIMVTGNTGSGKSTLFKLLTKQIYTKDILINNININKIPYSDIKNNITYVDQKSKLFIDSIKNNIVLDNKKYKKAYKAALIDEMLLDKKINDDYKIDGINDNLSGGEIQKILIAQALCNTKNILILDETTSQLDTDTERKILSNIKRNYNNLTLILISHRCSNMDLFDEIINIKNGILKRR